MKNLFLTLAVLLVALKAMPQKDATWQYPIINYPHHAYNFAAQNWMIEQQDNGWIYVANSNGVAEYDGVRWNTYSVNGHKARAIRKSPDGRLYVGSMSNFGYFEPDGKGGMHFISLYKRIMDKVHVGVVRNIMLGDKCVYFQDDRNIIMYKNNSLHVLDTKSTINSSVAINNRLFVATHDGIMELKGNTFVRLPSQEALSNKRIVSMMAYNGKLAIITRFDGIYTWSRQEGTHHVSTLADDFFRKDDICCATINGEQLAIGTLLDGIALVNIRTGETKIISSHNGLQNQTVRCLTFDSDGNLWVGFDTGIDYIVLSSAEHLLLGKTSAIGAGYASCVFGGRLYLGTNRGVYHTGLPGTLHGSEVKFLTNTYGQIWQFTPHNGELFCANENGVIAINAAGSATILHGCRGVRQIASLPGVKDAMIAGCYGTDRGLHLIGKENAKWVVKGKVGNFSASCKQLLADPHDERTLWFANKGDGLFRLKLSADGTKVVKQKKYNKWLKSVSTDMSLTVVNDKVCIATRDGLFTYNHAADTIARDTELEKLLPATNRKYSYIFADHLYNLWYSDGHALFLSRYDIQNNKNVSRTCDVYLNNALTVDFENVTVWNNYAILASEHGFSLLDLSNANAMRKHVSTVEIRRLYITSPSDSLLYGRSYREAEGMGEVVIPYANNSVRIEWSATNFSKAFPTQYSYRLDHNDKKGEWSGPYESNVKEFTNLHEGDYVFHVKAKTIESEDYIETSVHFRVLPPWYRTWWSYMLYLIMAAACVAYILHLFRRSKQRIVSAKNRELNEQKEIFQEEAEKKEQEINTLLEENLQAELRRKSEELVNTTLNLARKNEILLELKKDATNIYKATGDDDPSATKRKLLKLIGDINNNISHDNDLQEFQRTFDIVHNSFFGKLREACPTLSKREELLCAYIQMDLLSKEIAPLMNISVRGVEISRYRIRRKLGLEEGENLSEFLRKFSQA